MDALKEWQVAVNALEQGETIVLLRKGGIRESGGRFVAQRDRICLYPTVEHQKPELLKPSYAELVQPVASGWHPEQIRIGSWALITDCLQVSTAEQVDSLLPSHIWNQRFVTERLQWKPSHPLQVLLLRVYNLHEPQMIPFSEAYSGCKSWIELGQAIALENSAPVLSDLTYANQVAAIQSLLIGQ